MKMNKLCSAKNFIFDLFKIKKVDFKSKMKIVRKKYQQKWCAKSTFN